MPIIRVEKDSSSIKPITATTTTSTISIPWPKRQRSASDDAIATASAAIITTTTTTAVKRAKNACLSDQLEENGSYTLRAFELRVRILSAARRIQRAWRFKFSLVRTNILAASFLDPETGIPIEHAKSLSFESLTELLRRKSLLGLTSNFLSRVHKLCFRLHGNTPTSSSLKVINSRIFLSMLMISYFPDKVFDAVDSALERSLIDVSSRLSNIFHRIARCIVESGSISKVPRELTRAFIPTLFEYFDCFKSWKVQDELKLEKRIIRALIALEDSILLTRREDPGNTQILADLNAQIVRLRERLLSIRGKKVLDDYDEGRKEDRAIAAMQEHSVGLSVGSCSCMGSSRLSSEEIAHEVLLNPNLRMNDFAEFHSGQDLVGEAIFKKKRQFYWDIILEDMCLVPTPKYTRVIALLDEIREGIVESANPKNNNNNNNNSSSDTSHRCIQVVVLKEEDINSIINIPLIKQQMELSTAFEWNSFMNLVASIVSLIRNLQIKARVDGTDRLYAALNLEEGSDSKEMRPQLMCNALEFLHGRVDVLRVDASNKRISNIACVIKVFGIGYEQGKFKEGLANGSGSLEHTERWINDAVSRFEKRSELFIDGDLAYRSLYLSAVVALVAAPTEWVEDTVPETLFLDRRRLAQFHIEFNCIVDRSTVLTMVVHVVIGGDRDPSFEKRTVLSAFTSFLVSDTHIKLDTALVSSELGKAFDAGKLHLNDEEERARIYDVVMKGLKTDNAVRKLITDRVRAAWTNRLITAVPVDGSRLNPAAIRAFVPRIETAATCMIRFTDVNIAVHAEIYKHLIAAAAAAFH